jgi:uncharacterized protein YebE (UPF0316 family)
MCLKIFLTSNIDVSIGTIRTVLVVKGNRLLGAILAFFEVFIWFFAAREALNTIDSILIPIFYAGGFATGTYIGTLISNNYLDGLIGIQIITKSNLALKIIKEIRNSGYGVSVIDLKNTQDNISKKMLLIQLNKKRLKDITKIVRRLDPNAFVIINETKCVQKGVIK